MKIKHKRIAASGVAIALAGVMGIGALLQTSVSVQASSAMMPGIEEIVSETTEDKPFRILEIVDSENEAEIGYYVSGEEPYIKLYKYTDENGNPQTFSSLEDGLSKLPEKQRKEFATNKITDEDGNISYTAKNVDDLCGDSGEEYPLAYSEYVEQYFVDSEDGWNRVNFVDADGNSRTDTVTLKGHYQENTAGNGDYTRQEQKYYPIRKGVDETKVSKYRENIEDFYYSDDEEAQAPYMLTFAEVKNEDVNKALEDENDKGQATILPEYDYSNGKYGYYENVYTDLTESIANDIQNDSFKFPGENPTVDENRAVLIQDNTPQGASAFSTGTEDFSSVNDGSEVGDSACQTDFGSDGAADFGTDEFSSGEFGDGSSAADVQVQPDQSTPQAVDSDSEQTDNANAEEQSTRERTILIGFANDETKGSTKNPYIYLGENIDTYPYYKYTLVGDLENIKRLAQANQQKDEASVANNTGIVRNERDITLEDGQYYYWKADTTSGQLSKYPLSIVTGRQAVPYSDIKKIDESLDYNYYYTVEKAYFCCEASAEDTQLPTNYKYYGWYYPSYPQNGEDTYLAVTEGDRKVATYYISDAEYKLTPGIGNYDFVSGGEEEQIVEVNHMYYQGGYVNHDWFKRYVFHLTTEDKASKTQFDNFKIKVDTIKSDKFDEMYGNETVVAADNMDAVAVTGTAENDNVNLGETINTDDVDINNISENQIADSTQDEELDIDETWSEVQSADEGEVSEVDSIISEAGVELVSIENEISDGQTESDSGLNEDAVVFSDGEETNSVMEFSADNATQTQAMDAANTLDDYDLIYINGILTSASANAIASISIPCIINTEKNMTEFESVFSELVKNQDTDGHYVNKYIYFFKNKWDSNDTASLVNRNFHENFNNTGGDFSDTSDSAEMEGFEEILTYIESENQYRQLGNSNNTEESDTDISDGTIELLNTEISQARVIEYIINYKYKRKLNTKSSINVLAIEPASVTGDQALSEDTVRSWLSEEEDTITIASVQACCEEETIENDGTTYKASNVMKNDSSFWHTKWTFKNGESQHKEKHYITINFTKSSDISGFEYTPREYKGNGGQNGKIQNFIVTLYDKNGTEITLDEGDESDNFSYDDATDSKKKTFTFKSGKTYTGVASVKITVTQAYSTNSLKHASCAYLKFFNRSNTGIQVNPPVVMTSSEFVGHIDDINSKYDMLYIGASGNRSLEINGDGDTMLYTHVGGLDSASTTGKWQLMGLYPQDFKTGGNTDFNRSSPTAGFRGSGNDITKQQYNELMSFVKSGYPVIIADELVSGNNINTETVDNSSYMYQFLKDALPYDNVLTVSEIEKKRNGVIFYTNIAKPEIVFSYKPPEAPRAGGSQITNTSENVYDYIQNQQLEYHFKIKNDSAISPVNTRYDCRLYFDLNFDGNLSDAEEQRAYMEIRDSSGTVQAKDEKTGYYQLKADEEYTLIRKIPSDYYKVIEWKLEIINNSNRNVRTSVIGYSKQQNVTQNGIAGQKVDINVLQIVPDFTSSDSAKRQNLYKNSDGLCVGGTWDLATEIKNNPNGFLATAINSLEDFNIEINRVTVSDFGKDPKTWLNEKEMVIIGFDDVYENIELNAVQEILKFISDGKSVIFSHDTTSFYNYTKEQMKNDYNTAYNSNFIQKIINTYNDKGLNWEWGVSLNKILREIVGMDRYGITSTKEFSSGQSVSDLLREGNDLTDGENGVSLKKLMELAGDVAYQTDSSGKTSYKETQGYANNQITSMNTGQKTTTVATKVNDGVITQYPYIIRDRITIADTHSQYYQLALEQDYDINKQSDGKNDIVVWYCLGGISAYTNSPNDVRNNYYFYSKGNVIYTGTGHSPVTSEMEIKLFINAMVAAANVAAVEPEVNFVKKEDPAADIETVRYYMTDQANWTEESSSGNLIGKEAENMPFYFNVKDYNMVSASLGDADSSGRSMTADIYIESDDGEVIFTDGPMKNKKVKKINSELGQLTAYKANSVNLDENGSFPLDNNNAYGFSIEKIERYLKTASYSYKKDLKIYVQITSKVTLYGSEKTKTSYASIDLKQRQLFDLD